MVDVNEVSEDTYRISIYVKDFDLQFNHFLVLDDEPLLYHAGMRTILSQCSTSVQHGRGTCKSW